MEVVQVNPEILNTASIQTKKQDTAFKSLQTEIMKGLMASCAAYTQLFKVSKQDTMSKKDVSRILKPMADAISLQANTSHSIDVDRRLSFKKDIKDDFASLCTSSYPVEDMLFGQELQEKIKSVDETAKLKLKVSLTKPKPYNNLKAKSSQYKYPYDKPYSKSRYAQKSSPFFVRGSFQNRGGSQDYYWRNQ